MFKITEPKLEDCQVLARFNY